MNLLPRQLVDSLIPEHLVNNTQQLYRYELFVVANISLVALILLAQIYSIGLSGQTGTASLWTLAFTVPLQVVLLGSLAIFFFANNYSLAVNASLTMMFLTVACVVAFLGGPLGSTSVAMLILPPVFAFVLLGLRSGIIWAVATYVVIFAGCLAELLGVRFHNISEPGYDQLGELIHITVAFIGIVLMIAFYEINNLRYRRELVEVAHRDGLTQLPNRTAFYLQIKRAIEGYEAERTPFTLIYIDLNDFKPINDDYGHQCGDKVLQVFAERLRSVVRQQDFIARLAGDEFAILLHDTVDSRIVQLVVDRLTRQMKRPINFRNGQSIEVAASIGTAFYPHDAASLEALLHTADERMYSHKRQTREVAGSGPDSTSDQRPLTSA